MIRRAFRASLVKLPFSRANASLLHESSSLQLFNSRAKRLFSSDRATGMDVVSPLIGLSGTSSQFEQRFYRRELASDRQRRWDILAVCRK